MQISRALRFFCHRPKAIVGAMVAAVVGKPERDSSFDVEWGTETNELVRLYELDNLPKSDVHGHRYQGCDPQWLREAFEVLAIPYRDFSFIDFGSGKGRALLIAGQFPFRRVVGIEFSSELVEICHRNLQEARYCSKCPIEVLCMDAVDFKFPKMPLVLFFFNPFDGTIMDRVLGNLFQSATVHEHPVFALSSYQGCPLSEHCRVGGKPCQMEKIGQGICTNKVGLDFQND